MVTADSSSAKASIRVPNVMKSRPCRVAWGRVGGESQGGRTTRSLSALRSCEERYRREHADEPSDTGTWNEAGPEQARWGSAPPPVRSARCADPGKTRTHSGYPDRGNRMSDDCPVGGQRAARTLRAVGRLARGALR